MNVLDIYSPPDIVDLIYKFAYSIKELFTTDNIRLCVVYLRMIDKFNLIKHQYKLITCELLGEACRGGNKKIMELLFNRIDQKFNDDDINMYAVGFYEAYRKGCCEIINKLNDRSPQDSSKYVQYHFNGICGSGNLEAVQLYLKKYPNDTSALCKWGLPSACYAGYLDIVKLLVENENVYDISSCSISKAGRGNQLHILNYLMNYTHRSKSLVSSIALWGALRGGHINLVKSLCAEYTIPIHLHGPRWSGSELCAACEGGHFSAVIYVLKRITTKISWDVPLYNACIGGNLEIVKLIMEKIKKPFVFSFDYLDSASTYAHIELISFMLKYNEQNSDVPA